MRLAVVAVVIVAALAVLVVVIKGLPARQPVDRQTSDAATFAGLRELAFHSTRPGPPLPNDTQPWGVVFEAAVPSGWYTVVAMNDGASSLYFSSGGGFIGGAGQPPIRDAAVALVAAAASFAKRCRPATSFPLPEPTEGVFYVLADAGTVTCAAPVAAMSSGTHELSPFYMAVQLVVTRFRELDEARSR